MTKTLVLLPGWGLGTAPLQPLADELQRLDSSLSVQLEPLPVLLSSELADWLEALDARLPSDAWLGGWSLGAMLASQLAVHRGEGCRGLLGLASNRRFVASEQWSEAMAQSRFAAFKQGCEQDATACLKRFSLLCSQGGSEPRQLSKRLLEQAPAIEAAPLLAGLTLLEQLDGGEPLQMFGGPQLHLFANADALVPIAARAALRQWLPALDARPVEGCHAFMLEHPQAIAAMVLAFMAADDD